MATPSEQPTAHVLAVLDLGVLQLHRTGRSGRRGLERRAPAEGGQPVPKFVDLRTAQGAVKVNPDYVTVIGPHADDREPATLVRVLGRDETLKVLGTVAEVEAALLGRPRPRARMRSV
jgi:hypothetical protein